MASHKFYTIFFALLSVTFLSAFNAADTPSSTIKNDDTITLDDGAIFHKSKCWFEFSNQDIECGWLDTAPVNGATTSDFQLPVVVFRYTGEDRKDDPVIYIAGGPGAGAWLNDELIQTFWQSEWESKYSKLKRDLVLFDQRGSGLSQPAIQCPQYEEHVTDLLLNHYSPTTNADLYREATLACHQYLVQEGIALNQLATRYSANDVVDIMTALGYPTWNIQSVSYGTRLGIEIQRRYPEKVRTLLLDSVYPPTAHLFQNWPTLLGDSLKRIFQHCETDSSCATSATEYQKRFWVLMDRLKKKPLRFAIHNTNTKLNHIMLSDQTLLAILFHTEYRTNILSYLNDAIFELEANRTQAIQPFVENYVVNLFDESFSDAVYWAVECHDNPDIDTEKYAHDSAQYAKLGPYLLKDDNICAIWNQGYTYTPLNAVKQANTPVLIFSGEDDPITPSDWAVDSAAEFDSHVYLFSFFGVSHSVLDNKFCATKLYNDFVNEPSKRPRANCRVGDTAPFFDNATLAKDDSDNNELENDDMLKRDVQEENTENEVIIAVDSNEKRLPH